MADSAFQPTKQQQISVSLAYVTYLGENLVKQSPEGQSVPARILALINSAMPEIPPLCDSTGEVDWQVVWGPTTYTFPVSILQDNMMFVAQQISQRSNYVVAIRGTNALSIMDWVKEDFDVWRKVEWQVPPGKTVQGTPQISKATNTGLDALLNKMTPLEDVPGHPLNITQFLTELVKPGKVNIGFTGHSLGGALSPTLALWFKQSQKIQGGWDAEGNAAITVTPFAGPTAGDVDFSNYFSTELGDACERIHNTLDMVPYGWENIEALPDLYSAPPHQRSLVWRCAASGQIEMPWLLKEFFAFAAHTVKGYRQIERPHPLTFTINPDYNTYVAQAAYQHLASYPTVLEVPSLLEIVKPVKKQLESARIIDDVVSDMHSALNLFSKHHVHPVNEVPQPVKKQLRDGRIVDVVSGIHDGLKLFSEIYRRRIEH